jgi:hypothetical protein
LNENVDAGTVRCRRCDAVDKLRLRQHLGDSYVIVYWPFAMNLILIVLIVLILLGGGGGYYYGGPAIGGGIGGLLLVILIIWLLMGNRR